MWWMGNAMVGIVIKTPRRRRRRAHEGVRPCDSCIWRATADRTRQMVSVEPCTTSPMPSGRLAMRSGSSASEPSTSTNATRGTSSNRRCSPSGCSWRDARDTSRRRSFASSWTIPRTSCTCIPFTSRNTSRCRGTCAVRTCRYCVTIHGGLSRSAQRRGRMKKTGDVVAR